MVGEIIETRKGETFEVVEDVGGPEVISIDRLEIVPLVHEKIPPHLTWGEFFDGDGGSFSAELGGFMLAYNPPRRDSAFRSGFNHYDRTYWDIRDRAKEMDAHLGIQHARCIVRAKRKMPDEWRKIKLLFPGTTLRSKNDGKLYIPTLFCFSDEVYLFFSLVFLQEWDLRRTRFVRWKR